MEYMKKLEKTSENNRVQCEKKSPCCGWSMTPECNYQLSVLCSRDDDDLDDPPDKKQIVKKIICKKYWKHWSTHDKTCCWWVLLVNVSFVLVGRPRGVTLPALVPTDPVSWYSIHRHQAETNVSVCILWYLWEGAVCHVCCNLIPVVTTVKFIFTERELSWFSVTFWQNRQPVLKLSCWKKKLYAIAAILLPSLRLHDVSFSPA